MKALIERNSNFHHFSKYLHEAINVFGTKQMDGDIKRFYHGISDSLLFEGTHAYIHGVLSTTSCFYVAVNFSHSNSGLVLELCPANSLKYFSCNWLSAYSHEQEKLFIGGFLSFTFIDIVDTTFGEQYLQYIKAISILDTMTDGKFFNDDQSIIGKLLKVGHWNPIKVGAKTLDSLHRNILIKLIKHELGKQIWLDLPVYVEQLFHNICVHKTQVIINWRALNTDISDNWCVGDGGHIGYRFLKPLFCVNAIDIGVSDVVDLKFINVLYPNASYVELFALQRIDVKMVENVLLFWTAADSTCKIEQIGLYLLNECCSSKVVEWIDCFHARFEQIECEMIQKKHEIHEWNGWLFHKKKKQSGKDRKSVV